MKRFISTAVLPVAMLFSVAGFTSQVPTDDPQDVRSFTVDRAHSNLGFKVRHLGITNVTGRFGDFAATLRVDPSDLTTLQTTATVQVASIDTGIERRDEHLRSDDFFDAANHPELTFVSREVRNVNGNSFELVGDLTIRGTTKEVVFDASYVGMASMGESQRIAFEASTVINRFDYGLKWDRLTEMGGLVAAEDVRIELEIQGIQE